MLSAFLVLPEAVTILVSPGTQTLGPAATYWWTGTTSFCCTLSPTLSDPILPPSLSCTDTHPVEQTHTHLPRANQAEMSWSESVSLKRGFWCRLGGVDSCSISSVQWQWVLDKRTKQNKGWNFHWCEIEMETADAEGKRDRRFYRKFELRRAIRRC